MEYKQNGLTFNAEDLVEIPLCDLNAQTISRAHIFTLLGRQKKPMLLLRAGDFIEQSFISQYLDRGMTSVFTLDLVSNESIQLYRDLWSKLKHSKIEREKLKLRDEFILALTKDFHQNNSQCCLNFLVSCFEEFNIFSNHVVDNIQDVSMVLYSRALLTSGVSTIAALTNSYVDYHFIKDLYNVSFILDYGLVEFGQFNYTMALACEKERNHPGLGVDILEKFRRPQAEMKNFLNHPLKSYNFAMTKSANFSHPELLEVIKYHHEKFDGSGFPAGLSYSGLSDFDTLISFCDYFIPFKEHHFALGDGHHFLFENYKKLRTAHEFRQLPIKKIMSNWEKMFNWAIEKCEQEKAVEQEIHSDQEMVG